MKNIVNKAMAVAISIAMVAPSGTIVNARNIGNLNNTTCTYDNWTSSSAITKVYDNEQAVVNLSSDSGSAWIKCRMVDKNNNVAGSVCLQRGTRVSFDVIGKKNSAYKLSMKKLYNTGGGKVTIINGSWSPDYR